MIRGISMMKTTYEQILKERQIDAFCEDCNWNNSGDNLEKVWQAVDEHCCLEHHKVVLASKRTKTFLIKEAEQYVPGSRTRRRNAIMEARAGISLEEQMEKARAKWFAMYEAEQARLAEEEPKA